MKLYIKTDNTCNSFKVETLFKINQNPHNIAQRFKFLVHYTGVNLGKIQQLY